MATSPEEISNQSPLVMQTRQEGDAPVLGGWDGMGRMATGSCSLVNLSSVTTRRQPSVSKGTVLYQQEQFLTKNHRFKGWASYI